jgi:hypothetical protein
VDFDVFGCAVIKKTDEMKSLVISSVKAPQEPVSTSSAAKRVVEKASKVEKDDAVLSSVSHITAIRALLDALLLRTTAFSSALLSEAMQLLDVQSVCCLLQILTFRLRGLVAVKLQTQVVDDQVFPADGDEQMIRAINLLEALIDAHFVELTMRAPQDEQVRRVLFNVIKAAKNAEEASDNLETTLGLWTQIERITSKQGVYVKPVFGLYQIEKLIL